MDAKGGVWEPADPLTGRPAHLRYPQPADPYAAAIAYAAAEGTANGRAAASWYFDGNTPTATYAAVLKGLEDGDPAVLDTLPAADLSGQWADTLTGPQLVRDAYRAAGLWNDSDPDEWHEDEAVMLAYEDAYQTAAEDAIAAACRYQIGGEE